MKAYIINLEKASHRREYMKNVLETMPYLNYEFIQAVDGNRLSDFEKQNIFDRRKFFNRYLRNPSNGEIGCTLSHQKCYQKVLDGEENYSFIFEDDLIINEDIKEKIELLRPIYDTNKPVIVLFSGWFWFFNRKNVNGIVLGTVFDGFLAQSYIINKAAAKCLYDKQPSILPDDWKSLRKKGVKIFGVIPHPCEQDWGEGLGYSIDHSQKVVKGHHLQKINIILLILQRKFFEFVKHFESCDYL